MSRGFLSAQGAPEPPQCALCRLCRHPHTWDIPRSPAPDNQQRLTLFLREPWLGATHRVLLMMRAAGDSECKTTSLSANQHKLILGSCIRAAVQTLQPSPVHSQPPLQPPPALSETAAPGPKSSQPQRWPCVDAQPTMSKDSLMNSPGVSALCSGKNPRPKQQLTPMLIFVQICSLPWSRKLHAVSSRSCSHGSPAPCWGQKRGHA